MKHALLVLLLSFVTLSAFAAPPVISFESGNTWAIAPPGHKVAWIRRGPQATGMAEDSDRDGRIFLSFDSYRDWLVVDVDTGEWQTARVETFKDLAPRSIVGGPTGAYTQVFTDDVSQLELWIRPGVGAWAFPTLPSPPNAKTQYGRGAVVDYSKMLPMLSSPARPNGIAHGDLVLMLNTEGFSVLRAGVVDAVVAPPSPPGVFSIDRTFDTYAEWKLASFRVVRSEGTAGTATVRFSVTGNVEAGVDYVFDPVDVTFAQGETLKRFELKTLDDGIFNGTTRNLVIQLTDPTGGAVIGEHGSYTLALQDDDPPPVLALGTLPPSVVEGDTPWEVEIPWTLTGAFRGPLPLHLQQSSGDGSDYTVAPGQTSGVVRVRIPSNDTVDAPREIHLSLSSPTPRIRSVEATLTVLDDDPPRLVADDGSGVETFGIANFAVRTEIPAGSTGLATFSTADGTAKAGEDYVAVQGESFDTPTLKEAFVTIRLIDDDIAEEPETFYVDILTVTGGATLPTRTRVALTIFDDDVRPTGVTANITRIREADFKKQTVVRVALPHAMQSLVQLGFKATGQGTAALTSDFTLPGPIVFLPGVTEQETFIEIAADNRDEGTETAEIAITNKWGETVTTTQLTIDDDDAQSFVNAMDTSVDELAGGVSYAVFPIAFLNPAPVAGSFQYSTTDGTATAGVDYEETRGTITFRAGDTASEVRVRVFDDDGIEAAETFGLRLSNIIGAGMYLHRDVAAATIQDNDPYAGPILTLSAPFTIEGHAGSTNVPVSLQLATASPQPITVVLATTTGTATVGADYVALSKSVTFQPGETSKEAVLVINGDTIDENDETIELTATHDGSVIAATILAIVDDESSKRRVARH